MTKQIEIVLSPSPWQSVARIDGEVVPKLAKITVTAEHARPTMVELECYHVTEPQIVKGTLIPEGEYEAYYTPYAADLDLLFMQYQRRLTEGNWTEREAFGMALGMIRMTPDKTRIEKKGG